ncbi:MAG: protein translocase subunit SecF [Pseudomonadota bacterium]
MFPIRFVPDNTSYHFMRHRRWSFPVSGLLIVGSIIAFMIMGLNLGIDFRGGTLIEIETKDGPADIGEVRQRLSGLGFGDVQVQEFGSPTDLLIRIERQPGGEDAQQDVVTKFRAEFGDEVEYRRVEVVGPRVSGELAQRGTLAVLAALAAVLVYIWFRFEWQFAVGSIIALVHDIILTIGMFAVVKLEFNLSSIAAILTIVGYSLNDTVVVYDRIRENLRRYKKKPMQEILDLSINQTLSRTALTSITTLLALLALYIFGGAVIQSFTFAMIWGVLVGTYSSIFIAAPVLIAMGLTPAGRKASAEGGKADADETAN